MKYTPFDKKVPPGWMKVKVLLKVIGKTTLLGTPHKGYLDQGTELKCQEFHHRPLCNMTFCINSLIMAKEYID